MCSSNSNDDDDACIVRVRTGLSFSHSNLNGPIGFAADYSNNNYCA